WRGLRPGGVGVGGAGALAARGVPAAGAAGGGEFPRLGRVAGNAAGWLDALGFCVAQTAALVRAVFPGAGAGGQPGAVAAAILSRRAGGAGGDVWAGVVGWQRSGAGAPFSS